MLNWCPQQIILTLLHILYFWFKLSETQQRGVLCKTCKMKVETRQIFIRTLNSRVKYDKYVKVKVMTSKETTESNSIMCYMASEVVDIYTVSSCLYVWVVKYTFQNDQSSVHNFICLLNHTFFLLFLLRGSALPREKLSGNNYLQLFNWQEQICSHHVNETCFYCKWKLLWLR